MPDKFYFYYRWLQCFPLLPPLCLVSTYPWGSQLTALCIFPHSFKTPILRKEESQIVPVLSEGASTEGLHCWYLSPVASMAFHGSVVLSVPLGSPLFLAYQWVDKC